MCVTTGSSAAESAHDGREGDVRLLLWPTAQTLRYLGFEVLEPVVVHGVHGYHRGDRARALGDRLSRALAAGQDAPGLQAPADLFATHPDGTLDTIHMNDQGHYLIALIHFATLYHRDPTGLPYALMRADGTPADPPSPAAAGLMQRVVWEMVSQTPHTGL